MTTRTVSSEDYSLENSTSHHFESRILDYHAAPESLTSSIIKKCQSFLSNNFNAGSTGAGFFSLTVATIGSGIMLLPGVTTYSGLIWGFTQLVICYLVSYYSLLTLIRCAASRKVCSYQELSDNTYGKLFRWIVNLSFFLGNGGVVVLYLRIISSLISVFITSVSSDLDLQNWVNGPVIATVFVLPLSLPRYLKQLRYLWVVSLLFVLVISSVIIQQSFVYQEIKANPQYMVKIEYGGFTKTFPTMVFAFMCHYNVLDVFGELTASPKKLMKQVVRKTTCFVFVLYSLVIIFGCITFTNQYMDVSEYKTQLILIDYYIDPQGGIRAYPTMVIVCLLMMSLVLVCKMPVFVIPAKDGIKDVFFPRKCDQYGHPIDTVVSPLVHFALVATTVYCCAGIATFIQSPLNILNVISSSFFTLACFVFPAIFYLNLPKKEQKAKHIVLSKIMLVTMTGFSIWNTYENIAEFFP